jgi:hypothetical protein
MKLVGLRLASFAAAPRWCSFANVSLRRSGRLGNVGRFGPASTAGAPSQQVQV